MPSTHFVFDTLQDPTDAPALADAWLHAGFNITIDTAAQHAALSINDQPLTESQAAHAAAIARHWGLEVRDRTGTTFVAANSVTDLHNKITYEYRCRAATALVFGLPAVALHYLVPVLSGGADDPRRLFYPWMFEALLVGWMSIAAGWPILWQGALGIRYRRPNPDLLTSAIIAASLLPSAAATGWLITGRATWLGTSSATGPAYHAAAYALILATTQRWLLHNTAERSAGCVRDMTPGFNKLVLFWLTASAIVCLVGGWHMGIAFALLLPPCASSGGINPWTPGWLSVLPVFGFAGFFLLAPRSLAWPIDGVEIEIAAGFAAIMTITYALGWKHTTPPHLKHTT